MAGVDDPVGQYGEKLFASYLAVHNLPADHEPPINGTAKLIDFVISTPRGDAVNAEVKTIWDPPPRGSGFFDPYRTIRAHIDIGREKFKSLKHALNVLVFTAFPGSFVDLTDPFNMLGSMVGNYGFTIPFNPEEGSFDSSAIQGTFLPGEGLMVRRTTQRNTRISALITLHNGDRWFPHLPEGGISVGAAQRLIVQRLDEPGISLPYVTVWENPVADRKLPDDIFNGPRDARWTHDGKEYWLSFKGEERMMRDESEWR